jgi:mono/diheme cytochrome c family protein
MRVLKILLLQRTFCAVITMMVASVLPASSATPESSARGAYLARITGCIGCHTPRTHGGEVAESRLMSGGDHPIAGTLGRLFPPNVTPDKTTGLGAWTAADIAKAIKTGRTPDGRILSSAMPWRTQFSALTAEDAGAIALYLQSLPAIRNAVPPPLPPLAPKN